MEIIKKYRQSLFPRIKDWTSSHNELRHYKEWWKLPYMQFIVFNEQGTKWFLLGVSAIGSITFFITGYILYAKYTIYLAIIPWIISLFLLRSTFLKLKSWGIKSYTLYDAFLRD